MLGIHFEPPVLTELVNREEQIKLFGNELKRIQNNRSVQYRLLEWYGGPGIGKTQLLRLLADECNRRETSWTLVNFLEAQNQQDSYEKDPALLLSRIVADLDKRSDINKKTKDNFNRAVKEFYSLSLPDNIVQAYSRLPREERLYRLPDWLSEWVNVVKAFVALVNALADPENTKKCVRPVAFFFDETEYASPLLTDWVEEWVINPLLRLPCILVVWTTRQPAQWRRPEVREKLQKQHLLPFTEDDVQRQLKARHIQADLAEELFKSVFELTNGHPYANDVTIAQIRNWQEDKITVTSNYIKENRGDVFQKIFKQFIQNYVFVALPQDVQKALELAAFARVFDSYLLRQLLQKHGGDNFVEISTPETQQILEEMKQTRFLIWRKGYELLPDLRRLIRKYYLTNEPDFFVAVNKTALQINRDWLIKVPDNLNVYAVEELYHLASLKEVDTTVNITAHFQERLDEYENWQNDPETRQHVLERLSGELEKDEELGQMLTHDELSTILAKVKERLKAPVAVSG